MAFLRPLYDLVTILLPPMMIRITPADALVAIGLIAGALIEIRTWRRFR